MQKLVGKHSARRLAIPLLGLLLFLCVVLPVALILGEEQERKVWASAPSTLHMYTTDEVCVDDESGKVLVCRSH